MFWTYGWYIIKYANNQDGNYAQMKKEDMECQGELISKKVEEHKYHIISFVNNSISRKLRVNDRNWQLRCTISINWRINIIIKYYWLIKLTIDT